MKRSLFRLFSKTKMKLFCLIIHTNMTTVIKYLTKKPKWNKPIDNDHTYCLLCEKVYPTQESLEFHFHAVHQTGMAKHTIERELSYQNYKVKNIDFQFQSIDISFGLMWTPIWVFCCIHTALDQIDISNIEPTKIQCSFCYCFPM